VMRTLVASLSLLLATASFAGDSGEEVWKARCKGCHGADGKAKTKIGEKEKMADFSLADWQKRHSDAQISQVILEGSDENPKMKPFKEKLTEEEVAAVVKFIRTLSPDSGKNASSSGLE
jgi:mono/diheme cytochrome c family protein